MSNKTTFIGHRILLQGNIQQLLKSAIENEIQSGCKNFIIGSHGEFDKTVLDILLSLKNTYPEIQIEVVITNYNPKTQDEIIIKENPKYETVMFEIEELHPKQRITASNKQMIDSCDTLICYVKPNVFKGGAKTTLDYAIKKNIKIINLYQETDDGVFDEKSLREFLGL